MIIEKHKMELKKVLSYERSLKDSLELSHDVNRIKIAGPCTIESEEMLHSIASDVRKLEIPILRGGSFKNRTSPYSFQGMESEGLDIHISIGKYFGLKSISEIMDASQIHLFKDIDIIQIGARSMKNYVLMKALVHLNKPIVLKRDMNSSLIEFLSAAEKLLYYGQTNLVLCERGVAANENYYKYILDLNAVVWLKLNTKIPIIVDPSHSAGLSELVTPLSHAAIASGADGLMIEVHNSPADALCDGNQALTIRQLEILNTKLTNAEYEPKAY